MRLVHFSAEPLGELHAVAQVDSDRRGEYAKPKGLWLSDEDDYGWRKWCEDEEYGVERLALAHEITLAEDANVLHLSAAHELDDFTERYGAQLSGWPLSQFGRVYAIDWQKVAVDYRGLLITPYQWERRLSLGWYYGWDCASACVWDPAAIASVERVDP